MTVINLYQSKFSLKNSSNCIIILFIQFFYMCFLIILILRLFVLKSSFFMRLNIYYKQKIKLGFQKMATANKIASTI